MAGPQVGRAERAAFWFARAAIWLAAVTPQWLGYRVAAVLGQTFFLCSSRRRRCALRFLRAAYPDRPDRELLRIGRIATGNICKVPIDMARTTRLLNRGGDLRSVVDYEEFERKMPPSPVLGAAAHLGSWEVAAIMMGALTGNAHVVVRTFKNPRLNEWVLRGRRQAGLTVHPRRGGIKPLADAVASGAVGLQAVDQHQRLRGVRAPFFGREASCERAVATLAVRRGYPILVGGAVRVGVGFRFRMVISEVFEPVRTGNREADVLATLAKINCALERMILAEPLQYLWIHDRYRDSGSGQTTGKSGPETT